MKIRLISMAAVAAMLMMGGAAGCKAPSSRGPGRAVDLLPVDGAVDGLHRAGPARVVGGDGLYSQIDGGAELYLELGFDQLVVQDYQGGGAELEVELYVMRDDVAAAGAYLESCGRETPSPDLADRNTVGDYQLQLLHGRYYLVVSDATGGGGQRALLVQLARAVEERLPPGGPLTIFEALPHEHRVPGSERIARGPLGLRTVLTLGEGDLLQLGGKNTAVAADYELPGVGRITQMVVSYPDPETAAAALRRVAAGLDTRHRVLSRGPSRLLIQDDTGHLDELWVEGPTLRARLNLPASAAGA